MLVSWCLFVCFQIACFLFQVFPLLVENFSLKEQADLVWHFLCSIPVNIMAEFLPWLCSSVSPDEHKDMITCLYKLLPEDKLLQQVRTWFHNHKFLISYLTWTLRLQMHQVIFAWMRGKHLKKQIMRQNDFLLSCVNYPNTRKRKHAESDDNVSSPRIYPINEILDWHNAIRKEVTDIAKEARQIQLTRDFTELSTFYSRLEFVADVCIYHRYCLLVSYDTPSFFYS